MNKTMTEKVAEANEKPLARAILRSFQETQRLANVALFERSLKNGNLNQAIEALNLRNVEKKLING